MKSYSSREILKILEADGWYFVRSKGDHFQYKHDNKPGLVTVRHPVKDLDINDVKSIFKQAKLNP